MREIDPALARGYAMSELATGNLKELLWTEHWAKFIESRDATRPLSLDLFERKQTILISIFLTERNLRQKGDVSSLNHPEGLTCEEALIRFMVARFAIEAPNVKSQLEALSYEQRRELVFERFNIPIRGGLDRSVAPPKG